MASLDKPEKSVWRALGPSYAVSFSKMTFKFKLNDQLGYKLSHSDSIFNELSIFNDKEHRLSIENINTSSSLSLWYFLYDA